MPWDGRDTFRMQQMSALELYNRQMAACQAPSHFVGQAQAEMAWAMQNAAAPWKDPDTETIAADLGELGDAFREMDLWIAGRAQMLR